MNLLIYRVAAEAPSRPAKQQYIPTRDCIHIMDLVCLQPDRAGGLREKVVALKNLGIDQDGPLEYLELAFHLVEGLTKGEMESGDDYRARLRKAIGAWGKFQTREIDKKVLWRFLRRYSLQFTLVGLGSSSSEMPLIERLVERFWNFSWVWLITHARVVLAEELLSSDVDSDRACSADAAVEAGQLLEEAIRHLEDDKATPRDCLIRKKHLYALRAQAQNCFAQLQFRDQARTRKALGEALDEANKAVGYEPEGASERLRLGVIYSALTDYKQAADELRVSWQLQPSPKVLDAIVRNGWAYCSSRLDPIVRHDEMEHLADILEKALVITEIADQSSEPTIKHGMAHFWLGKLRGELCHADQAVYNLRVARSLGYKPIEVSLVLGGIFLEQNAFSEAEETFRIGVSEIQQYLRRCKRELHRGMSCSEARRKASCRPAQALGEDRPINDLLAELLLGWALSIAERRGDLKRARRLTEIAGSKICFVRGATSQRRLRALHAEVVGWILFREQHRGESLRSLTRSVELQASPSAYYHLGVVCLERARREMDPAARKEKLDLALETPSDGPEH